MRFYQIQTIWYEMKLSEIERQFFFTQGTVDRILEILKDSKFDYVGHRVVHGGEVFKNAAKMDTKNIEKLSGISSLAPLHNPIQTEVVKTCCLRYLS